MSATASQFTTLTIVDSTIYLGTDQSKHQSSALLAFVRGIHWWPVNSLHKGPVMRKMFPFDGVIMNITHSVVDFRNPVSRETSLCDESRLLHGILVSGLVYGQWYHASGSFPFIKWSNEGCLAGRFHVHKECHINPLNQPLYARQVPDVR